MFVLNRKIGEKIVIDDNITITVLVCNNTRVKLGIETITDVSIRRGSSIKPSMPVDTGCKPEGDMI